jgi:hypothetical protein
MSDTISLADLSEEQVRTRLQACEDAEVVNELYTFGQRLAQEAADNIRAVESKATSFAAYGAAIVTLLVSSSATWSTLGNKCTLWIGFCAGITGLLCTYLSISALSLKEYECISQDEWLKEACFSRIEKLKRYRILTLWGMITSHGNVQRGKAVKTLRAEIWLTASVACLAYLLLQITVIRAFDSFKSSGWVSFWESVIHYTSWIPGWQYLLSRASIGSLITLLPLGLIGLLALRRSGRVN